MAATLAERARAIDGDSRLRSVRLARLSDVADCGVDDLLADRATEFDWQHYDALQLDAPLSAALEAFCGVGYHGATMRDLARRAGLSVPGVYHHWVSKQEMLVALMHITMDELLARCHAALVDVEGPTRTLSRLVECLVLFHCHRRDLAFLGSSEMRSLEPEAHEIIAADRIQVQRMFDKTIDAGVSAGEFSPSHAREASRAIVSMSVAVADWYSEAGPGSAEEIAADYVEFALRMLDCASATA